MTNEELEERIDRLDGRIDNLEYILAQTIQLVSTANATIKTLLETQSAMVAAMKVMQDHIRNPLVSAGHNEPPLDIN